MKITAHVEIVGAGLPYEKAFPLLRKLGAQGVELVVKDTAPLNLASTDGDFLRAKRLAEDEGLVISGASNGYSWSLPMTSDSAKTRDAGARALRRVDYPGTATAIAESVMLAWPMDQWDPIIERHPIVVWFGGGLLGWIAGGMIVTDRIVHDWIGPQHDMVPTIASVIGALLVIATGKWLLMRRTRDGAGKAAAKDAAAGKPESRADSP